MAQPSAKSHPTLAIKPINMDALLAVFSDWPHLLLLGGATFGGVLVGIGILKESETWNVAAILVLIGVIIEPIFTLWLFVYDENISRAQQSTIVALETTLSPRVVEQAKAGSILAKFSDMRFIVFSNSDSEPTRTAAQIRYLLRVAAHWEKLSAVSFPFPPSFFPGVVVHSGAVVGPQTDSIKEDLMAAQSLIDQLNLSGIETRSGAPLSFLGAHGIAILVGPRPLPLFLQRKLDSSRYGEALYDDP
jgi:hypothetical protein